MPFRLNMRAGVRIFHFLEGPKKPSTPLIDVSRTERGVSKCPKDNWSLQANRPPFSRAANTHKSSPQFQKSHPLPIPPAFAWESFCRNTFARAHTHTHTLHIHARVHIDTHIHTPHTHTLPSAVTSSKTSLPTPPLVPCS